MTTATLSFAAFGNLGQGSKKADCVEGYRCCLKT